MNINRPLINNFRRLHFGISEPREAIREKRKHKVRGTTHWARKSIDKRTRGLMYFGGNLLMLLRKASSGHYSV